MTTPVYITGIVQALEDKARAIQDQRNTMFAQISDLQHELKDCDDKITRICTVINILNDVEQNIFSGTCLIIDNRYIGTTSAKVKEEKELAIVEYSPKEGARWQPMDATVIVPNDAILEEKRKIAVRSGTHSAIIGGYLLHAFRASNGRIWDAFNGWRPTDVG